VGGGWGATVMRRSAASVLDTGLIVRFCVRTLFSRKISFKNVFSYVFKLVSKVMCRGCVRFGAGYSGGYYCPPRGVDV
jgi:hypothetical protein